MNSDDKYIIAAFVFLLVLLLLLAFGIIRYKTDMDAALKDYFSQCVKINEETIQCPFPK